MSAVRHSPRKVVALPLRTKRGVGARVQRRRVSQPVDSTKVAREQFARTFADVLSGRFGGRWSVEWEGADRPALPADRDRRTLTGEE